MLFNNNKATGYMLFQVKLYLLQLINGDKFYLVYLLDQFDLFGI